MGRVCSGLTGQHGVGLAALAARPLEPCGGDPHCPPHHAHLCCACMPPLSWWGALLWALGRVQLADTRASCS